MSEETNSSFRLKFRTIVPVVKAAGMVPSTITFLILFVVASLIVFLFEPGFQRPMDAIWFCFQVVTTIGLGDYTCITLACRIVVIVLSVYSVFFLALLTGAVVNYCSERMRAKRDESIAQFLHDLEHLPELSREELAALSEKVKRIDRQNRK